MAKKKQTQWKVWAVMKKNGQPDGVSFCKTAAAAANDLTAQYGETIVRAILTLGFERPARSK